MPRAYPLVPRQPVHPPRYLLVHGVADRVFAASGNVLTEKGVVPQSAFQRQQFQALCRDAGVPREALYAFAVMELDRPARPRPSGDAQGWDLAGLVANSEGLCYVGALVTKEEGRGQVAEAFAKAREMGITVVVCSCDTRTATEASLAKTGGYQHRGAPAVLLEGPFAEATLTNEFWAQAPPRPPPRSQPPPLSLPPLQERHTGGVERGAGDAGTVPSMVGTAPSMVGTAPSMVGTVPSMVGTAPSMVGIVPTMVGTAPRMVGIVPTMVGIAPRMVGIYSSGLSWYDR